MWSWGYPVFARQEQVASRAQLLRAGVTKGEIDSAVRSHKAVVLSPGVYGLAGAPPSARGQLIAATLARPGAVVSHQSAGDLWGFLPGPPPQPTLTLRRGRRLATGGGMVLHGSSDLTSRACSQWRGFVCTNPMRTLVDLAAELAPPVLDDTVDRALLSGLVSPEALAAEAARTQHRGRAGPRQLLRSLASRGLVGSPKPSVLESRVERLFAAAGIEPLGAQVPTDDIGGVYVLDYLLAPDLVVEVEGFVYHSRSGDHRRDNDRFNELQIAHLRTLKFTWYDVCHRPDHVVAVIRRALAPRATTVGAARSG
jgi:hypothetical protein